MGKVSRKKQKLTKAAKSAKLDGGDAEIKVENGPKKLIDEALQYFKNGDAQSAKKIARRVIKVLKYFLTLRRKSKWSCKINFRFVMMLNY